MANVFDRIEEEEGRRSGAPSGSIFDRMASESLTPREQVLARLQPGTREFLQSKSPQSFTAETRQATGPNIFEKMALEARQAGEVKQTPPPDYSGPFGPTLRRFIEPGREAMERFRKEPGIMSALNIPLAGLKQASAIIGGPVEAAARGIGFSPKAAEVAGDVAEIALPLGSAKAIQTGMMQAPKLAALPRTVAEAVGVTTTPAPTLKELAESEGILKGAKNILSDLSARWGRQVDQVGEQITKRVPKVFRAGRGTPLEFRESRMQMEADVANGIEQAINLGTPLKNELTTGQKLRAEQVLRGSITTDVTPEKVVKYTTPIRKELDRLQNELVKEGRLSPETVKRFQDNFGPYFARLYASKEFTQTKPVIPWIQPTRSGSPRLLQRGERIEVEIPSLEKEMKELGKLFGPEQEFKATFRQAARETAKRRETIRGEKVTENVTRATEETKQTVAGAGGEFTEVPLTGIAARLEKVVTDALETRGMSSDEARAAVGRVKSAAVKAAEGGPEVKITGGGTTTERVTQTIRETVERQRETVKEIIENLGINNAQKAALHAYYDAITRAAQKTKTMTVDGQKFKIGPVMDAESALERVEALDDFLAKGFRIETREGNKVTLFRDISEEARKGMGELREQPGFVAAKSIAQASREVAVSKFFNGVAKNPEWTSDAAREGFTQMGDSVRTLGSLASKWVRSDIAAELNETTKIKTDWERITTRLTQMWKVGKVTNPATIARNAMSSAIMADWGGLSSIKPSGIRSYARTADGFLGKDIGAKKLLDEAKDFGVFRGTFNQQEINNLADGMVRSPESNPMLRMLDAVSGSLSKVGDKTFHATKVYGAVDYFYKGALYLHGRVELGMAPRVAARYARKYGIDYADISPFVRTLRDLPFGAPFATFASKAIPLAIETAVKHPVRFWKYPVALMGLSEWSKAGFDEQREEINQVQNLGELKSPRFALLPEKDKDGRFQFLDLGYILPFGDILESIDRLRGGGGSNIAFEVPGGPGKSLLEVAFNRNDFTEKPIYEAADTRLEAARKVTNHLLQTWLPAFAPPIPGTGFRGGFSIEAFRRATVPQVQLPGEAPLSPTDAFGHARTLGTTTASKIFGLNVKSAKLQELQLLKMVDVQRRVQQLSGELVKIQRSGITEGQKGIETTRITDRIKKTLEDARDDLLGGQSLSKKEADTLRRDILKDQNVPLEEKMRAAIR